MDVSAWLKELGLDRYEKTFRENEVDARSLPHLTGEDLQEMGVTAIGHRRLLLQAIATLRSSSVIQAADVEVLGPTAEKPEAERRQLTVLFCDLVGSTELSAGLDPEDMGAVLREYHECCTQVVKRWDGHIAKYMGDGILAYFGYPRAHEEDAERAVRAGLDLTKAVGQLKAKSAPLAARVGIATGRVMVGELIGEGSAREQSVVGETPNLAARLQALAKPGSVVISASTQRLVGGLFNIEDLGKHALKGFGAPLRAWCIISEIQTESRFEALHGGRLTPLVGRDAEIILLLRRWQQAKDGEGQVVLLSGEPGIGKSRITSALRERTADDPQIRMQLQCSPFFTNTAFYPIVAHFERALHFHPDLPSEEKLDRLEALLSQATNDVRSSAPLFAALLVIPSGDRYHPLGLSPQRQKERTIEVLVDQIEQLARQKPVLIVFEDVHWIDPTTLELVDRLVAAVSDWRVLMLITFRPEFSQPWGGFAHVTAHTLNRLGRRDCAVLAAQIAGGKELPEQLRVQIIQKTDGVPLFVEELTKAVLESNLLDDKGDHYALSGAVSMVEVPTTLHDSLMARLDRLAPAKEVAQVGAAIGREFTYELVATISAIPSSELQDALGRLVSAQLVFQRGAPPTATYVFKHALVQDAAYGSMLKIRRQQLHLKIAKTLEANFPQTVDTEPELIAHHFTEAGLIEPAIAYWKRAGENAAARSANVEAIGHLRRGLALVRNLPDTVNRAEQELMLLNALAAPLMYTKGYAAPETVGVYERAHQLCREVGESIHIFQALAGISTYHMVQGKVSYALTLAEEMIEPAERQKELGPIMEAHRLLGLHSLYCGSFRKAARHFQQVQDIFDPAQRQRWTLTYGQDHMMSSLILGSWALAALGYPDQSHAWRKRAISEAEKSRHCFSQAYASAHNLYALYLLDEVEMIKEAAPAAISFSTEQGFPFYATFAQAFEGWACTRRGNLEDGVIQMRAGIEGFRSTGTLLFMPEFFVLLADGLGRIGQFEEAFQLIEKSLDQSEKWGERQFEADAHRVKASLLLLQDESNQDEAERHYVKAIEVARRQDAKLWELRAATGLAQLWRDQGRKKEARELLLQVYGWFTEGFGVPTVQEANQTLNTLG